MRSFSQAVAGRRRPILPRGPRLSKAWGGSRVASLSRFIRAASAHLAITLPAGSAAPPIRPPILQARRAAVTVIQEEHLQAIYNQTEGELSQSGRPRERGRPARAPSQGKRNPPRKRGL